MSSNNFKSIYVTQELKIITWFQKPFYFKSDCTKICESFKGWMDRWPNGFLFCISCLQLLPLLAAFFTLTFGGIKRQNKTLLRHATCFKAPVGSREVLQRSGEMNSRWVKMVFGSALLPFTEDSLQRRESSPSTLCFASCRHFSQIPPASFVSQCQTR